MNDPFFGTSGPRNADIFIIGESWGEHEASQHRPFIGSSGQILDALLQEAHILRQDCFVTNVVSAKPPQNNMYYWFDKPKESPNPPLRNLHPKEKVLEGLKDLIIQLRTVKPKLIIVCGNYALWAITNCTNFSTTGTSGIRHPTGIVSWRGSMLYADALPEDLKHIKVLPIIHPEAIRKDWAKRAPTKHDLQVRIPMALGNNWRTTAHQTILAPPTFERARSVLIKWLERAEVETFRLANDIETARGLMTCIGFSDSIDFAMTIPFIKLLDNKAFDSFYSYDEEQTLNRLIRKVLTHPNIYIEGQNYLYDIQYIQAFLSCKPNLKFDYMLAHHLLFPGTPKGLGYLSSMYCEYHWYWKDDDDEWDIKGDLLTHLRYNAMDCMRSFEVGIILRELLITLKQEENYKEEMEKNYLAWDMMNRGVKIDTAKQEALAIELSLASTDLALWFHRIIPQHIIQADAKVPWFRSPKQQRTFFSEDLGLHLPLHRKTKQPTFGKDALNILTVRHPEFTKLFDALSLYRSIEVFHNSFIKARLDYGDRMRCMWKVTGTDTFRFASAKNAFKRGTNFQAIPEGEEE